MIFPILSVWGKYCVSDAARDDERVALLVPGAEFEAETL